MITLLLAMTDSEEEKEYITALYQTHYGYLLRIAEYILKDPGLAQDAVQEAFIAVIRNHLDLGPIHQPKAINTLRIIVRNKALNILKKHKLEKNRIIQLDEAVADRLRTEEPEGVLGEALAGLSEEAREVLMLRFAMGYSSKEAAQILSITQVSLRKRVSRAKKALVQKLEESGYGNIQ